MNDSWRFFRGAFAGLIVIVPFIGMVVFLVSLMGFGLLTLAFPSSFRSVGEHKPPDWILLWIARYFLFALAFLVAVAIATPLQFILSEYLQQRRLRQKQHDQEVDAFIARLESVDLDSPNKSAAPSTKT